MRWQRVHAILIGMYLRTTSRRNKDGSVVRYYQLAHNEWDPQRKRSTARVIHNFGRADELDRDALVRLCCSIARVCGVRVEDPGGDAAEGPSGEEAGLPGDVRFLGSRELGIVWLAEALWEGLGIGPCLRKLERTSRVTGRGYERAVFAMVANRLSAPESKLGVWERWLGRVYLPSCWELGLDRLYEAMDWLYEHAEAVEREVFFHTADLLNLAVDVIFYDTTTASFAIDEEDGPDSEGIRRLGHSKEGTWSPQVVVALAVTREGFPVRSWVFPGNTTDVTTVERVRKDLRDWRLGRVMFVGDAGMNSAENREVLARGCGHYILATPLGESEIRDEVLSRAGRYRKFGENLWAKEVVVGEGVRRRRTILCYNPKEAERQRARREEVLRELEEELARHPSLDATQKWAAELRASKRYGRYLTVGGKGKKTLRIDQAAMRRAERTDGKWVIETNDDTLRVEDAVQGYRGLMVIERCFRSMKRTQIRMTPMWHRLEKRIVAHVKLCVLALLLERVAEHRCGKSWARIAHALSGLTAGEFEAKDHRFFQRSEITPEQREIFKSLEITEPKRVFGIRKNPG